MMKTESISAQNRESLRQLRRRLVREQRAVSIRKFFRNKLSVVGMVLVLLMLICAVFAPLITGLLGVDPYTATMQERFQAPSVAHLFGTDNLGRDIFARVLYGAQISMTVGFTVGLLSALIGTALGLYASVNKVLDNVLMRLCDGLKAIPNILLAITLMAVLGANMKNVIISLTIVSIPGVARIARSQALLAREQTYAEAMTAVGGAGGSRKPHAHSLAAHPAQHPFAHHRADDVHLRYGDYLRSVPELPWRGYSVALSELGWDAQRGARLCLHGLVDDCISGDFYGAVRAGLQLVR